MNSSNNPDFGLEGPARVTDLNSEYNALTFIIKQIMGRAHISAMCKVVAVTGGGVGNAPYVTLQPLVNQTDGYGNAIPCGLLHNVPCFRLQASNRGIICDPQVNDIGVALFSDRDMSALKSSYNSGNRASVLASGVNPNTRRRFSASDGMFFGGFYNNEPTTYVQFLSNIINIISTNTVNIEASAVINLRAPKINLSSWAGMIAAFGRTTAPSGWIACPIAETLVSAATYPDLFDAIGYTWGGSGADFGLPVVPTNYSLIARGGVGTQSTGVVKQHTHNVPNIVVMGGSYMPYSNIAGPGTGVTDSGVGLNAANLPAGSRVLFCVKY